MLHYRYEELGGGVRLMHAGPERGELELLCLPCAGGSSTNFKALFEALPRSWHLTGVEPPGHGLNEGRALESIEAMVSLYLDVLGPQLERRPVLLGHSLGGLLAFLIQRRLEAEGRGVAGVVIAAARHPPKLVDERWSTLSDAALIERLAGIGGVPEVLRARPTELAAYLPAARADFRALERFADAAWDRSPIAGPAWVVVAGADTHAPVPSVEGWLELARDVELVIVPGDHFFIQREAEPFASFLCAALGS